MVLDGVVGAALENFGDFGPSVALLHPVHQEQDPLLLTTPSNMFDHWVQVVVPALPALLAKPVGHILSEEGPVVGSMDLHKFKDQEVLACGPYFSSI